MSSPSSTHTSERSLTQADAEKLKQEIKDAALDLLSKIYAEVSVLPEFHRTKDDLLTKALQGWAGKKLGKKILAGRILKKVTRPDVVAKPPTDMDTLACWGHVGELMELGIRYATIQNQANPAWLAEKAKTPILKIMDKVDFGDLYEMVASSEARAVALQEMLQEVADAFPTKAGLMPAIKLKQKNIALKKLNMMLAATDDLSPDMLVRTFLSLLDSIIEVEELSLLTVKLTEIFHKVRVGDILEGEAGKGLLQIILTGKYEKILADLDPVLVRKALVGLAELKEGAGSALLDARADQPELLLELVNTYFGARNARIRSRSKKAAIWEECPEEELARAAAQGMVDLDMEEMAETVNTWLRIANAVREHQPEIALTPVSAFVAGLDRDELVDAAEWLVPDVANALRPVAGTVMPELIKGFCRLLEPMPGQDWDDMEDAMDMLRETLLGKGD